MPKIFFGKMKKFASILFIAFAVVALFAINGCKKTTDWRDAFIGSYNGMEWHERKSTNYVTGQAYGYSRDSFVNKNLNFELIKNGKSNQITVRINSVYYCDADKDGFSTRANATVYFNTDSLKIVEYIPSDTFFFGRFVYVAKKN